MVNTYEDFFNLISDVKKTKNLKPGCYYYIEHMDRKNKNKRTVYHGKYTHTKTETFTDHLGEKKTGTYDYFDNIIFFVNPFKEVGRPAGFKKGICRYFIDNRTSCDSDIQNKKDVISELEETITHYKYKPNEENDPNLYWIGEEFKKAKESFEKKTRTNKGGKNKRRNSQRRKTQKIEGNK